MAGRQKVYLGLSWHSSIVSWYILSYILNTNDSSSCITNDLPQQPARSSGICCISVSAPPTCVGGRLWVSRIRGLLRAWCRLLRIDLRWSYGVRCFIAKIIWNCFRGFRRECTSISLLFSGQPRPYVYLWVSAWTVWGTIIPAQYLKILAISRK